MKEKPMGKDMLCITVYVNLEELNSLEDLKDRDKVPDI